MIPPVSPLAHRRASRWDAALLVAVAVGVVFAHYDAIRAMVRLWNVSPMYSYGFSIPFLSAYLVWARRHTLRGLVPAPSYAGGAMVLGFSLLLALAGRAGGIQLLDQIAVVVSVAGAVLLLFGWAYVRATWAALAYLLLMVPIWDGFTDPLHARFQSLSAEIGVAGLHAVGIPAYHEGTIIALPDVTLEVARSCSGVNYLVAVLALGLPLSYLQLDSAWRRVVLLATAVVVAALSNGLRVTLIGALTYLDIGSPLHGPGHVLHGLFVAAVGYAVLFLGLRVLAPRRNEQAPTAASEVPLTWFVPRLQAFLAIAVFVVLGSGLASASTRAVPLLAALEQFSTRLGPWTADHLAKPQPPAWWPTGDVSLDRRYVSSRGASVDVHVAYFEAQRQSRELATYRSAEVHRRATPLAVRGRNGGEMTVNLVPGADGTPGSLVWYEVGARSETSLVRVKLRTMWNALATGKNHGAIVMLAAVPARAGGASVSTEELGDFALLVRHALARHVALTGVDSEAAR